MVSMFLFTVYPCRIPCRKSDHTQAPRFQRAKLERFRNVGNT